MFVKFFSLKKSNFCSVCRAVLIMLFVVFLYKFTLQYDMLEPLKILSIQFLVKENNEIEIKDYEVGKNEIKIQK